MDEWEDIAVGPSISSGVGDWEDVAIGPALQPSTQTESNRLGEAYSLLGSDATPTQAAARVAVGGLTRFLPFGEQLVAGGSSTIDDIVNWASGREVDPQSYDKRLGEIKDYQKAFGIQQDNAFGFPLVDAAGALAVPTPNLPSKVSGFIPKTVAATVEGAGQGGLFGFESGSGYEDRMAKAKSSATVGGIVSLLLGAPLAAVSSAAEGAAGPGKQLLRKSIGTRASDYAKTADEIGVWDIVDDEVATKTAQAIDDLEAAGTLGDTASASKMMVNAVRAEKGLSDELNNVITGYDKAGGAPVLPKFQRAQEYIASGSVPANESDRYWKQLSELYDGIKNQGKGSLEFLQRQKVALGKQYEVGNGVKNGFNRALYHDIQEVIEAATPQVKQINQSLAQLKIVRPILQRNLGGDEAKNFLGSLIQKLRTSGGTLTTPTIIGSVLGGGVGGVAGAAGGALLGAASSPAGQRTVGKALLGLAEQAPTLSAAVGAAPKLGGAAASLSSNLETSPVYQAAPAGQKSQIGQSERLASSSNSTSSTFPLQSPPNVFSKDFGKLSKAVEQVESDGKADAVSSKGAVGLMQVTPIAFREVVRAAGGNDSGLTNDEIKRRLKDPKLNKQVGEAYLKMMLDKYGDLELALAAYNHGPTAVDNLIKKRGSSYSDIEAALPKETREYIPKVQNIFDKA